jgi:hypothetical protein
MLSVAALLLSLAVSVIGMAVAAPCVRDTWSLAPELLWGDERGVAVAPRAETDALLGSSMRRSIEMYPPLWPCVWGALGTGTFDIRVVR